MDENATASERNEAKLSDLQTELANVNKEVEGFQERLTAAREEAVGETNPAIEHLERSLAGVQSQASVLQTEIDELTGVLERSEEGTDVAAAASENYSLALARLKANAEDTRDALSDTVDISTLGANYSAAIVASDAYYAAQIANAEAALAKEEENSQASQKIETDLFNLRREQVQARERLTREAGAVGEAESQKRIAAAEAENEAVQAAGEETARALTESQKRQSEAAAAEQKQLTEEHEQALKAREAAQQAADERIVRNSQEQLEILKNNFQNLPDGVDQAYSVIQQATIEHYEILKSQARTRITDEDALNSELVSLDRQRNAELQSNHRSYLQRIASDAKELLGERTDAFREASGDILHNWEQTVSEFERRLREADTEDAIQQIEGEFTEAQQQMLASLSDVLTELGFTAEQAAEIMTKIFRTAETEADGFADKVISAFKRLGRESDRETKKQNREIERSYRELVRDIENVLGSITDFFFDIANDGDIEQAFKDLGGRLGNALVDEFNQQIAGQIASAIASESAAGAGSGSGLIGGGSILSGLSASLAPILAPAIAAISAVALVALPIYGAIQKIQNPDLRSNSDAIPSVNRLRDPVDTTPFDRGQRYQNVDAPAFNRGQPSYTREIDEATEQIDEQIDTTLEQAVEAFGGFYEITLSQLQESLDQSSFNLDFARQTGQGIPEAIQGVIASQTDFYQHQIDEINRVRRETGNLSFGNVEELIRQINALNNDARLQLDAIPSTGTYQAGLREARALAQRTGTDQQATQDVAIAQYGEDAFSGVNDAGQLIPVDQQTASSIGDALDRARFTLDQGVDAFQNAAQIGAVTIERIQELWDTHVAPNLSEYYDAALEHANAIEDPEDRKLYIDQNHLQSPESFAAHLENTILSPVIDAQTADNIADALNRAKFNLDEGVNAFRNAAQVGTVTIEQIQNLWDTHVAPNMSEYFAAAQNHANTITDPDDRDLFIERNHLQSSEAFAVYLESTYLSPVIDAQTADNIADRLTAAKTSLDNGVMAFQNATRIGVVTVEQIQTLWDSNVVPNLSTYYQAALNHADTISDPDDRRLFIESSHLQSPEAFTQHLESTFLSPVIDAQLADNIADSLTRSKTNLDNGVTAFQNAAQIGTVTIEQIQALWDANVVPNLSSYYEAALEHANTITDADDRQLFIEQNHLQSPEAFAQYLEDTILSPVIDEQTADDIADTLNRAKFNLDEGVNAFRNAAQIGTVTIEQIQTLWDSNVAPNISEYYEAALAHADTIKDPDDRDQFIESSHLQSPEAFAQHLQDTYLNPVINDKRQITLQMVYVMQSLIWTRA